MRLKELIFRTADAAGILGAVAASRFRRQRLLILCYHGISMRDEHLWNPSLYMTQEQLRQRLRALRDAHYHILPLTEAVERLYAGTLPPRSVALTFDDGAVDFERRALPVLREFQAPATLYLTTYYTTKRMAVFNTMLSYLLWKGRESGADLASLVSSPAPLLVATREDQRRTWTAITSAAAERGLDASQKDELLRDVATAVAVDFDDLARAELLHLMTPEVVRALPADLVDVQLHTHRHRTPRDRELFMREVRENAELITEMRGAAAPLDHFCYPSGEYFGEFLAWLPECGVRYATTCVPDLASRASNPLLLPRFVDTTAMSDTTFKAWITGFAALLPKKRRYRIDPARLEAQ